MKPSQFAVHGDEKLYPTADIYIEVQGHTTLGKFQHTVVKPSDEIVSDLPSGFYCAFKHNSDAVR